MIQTSLHRPYNSIEHLLKSTEWNRGYMLMITGYFDETGDMPDVSLKLNGMAGFVAPAEDWIRIQGEWLMHISNKQYDNYHDKDIRKGRREERRKPLLDILESYDVLPIGWFVSMDKFRALGAGEQQLFGDPYYRAYIHCLFMTTGFRGFSDQTPEVRSTQKVLTFFAHKRTEFEHNAMVYFERWGKASLHGSRLFEEPIFLSAKDRIPLGMADMLCAVLRDEYERELYFPDAEPAESFKRIEKMADNALSDAVIEKAKKFGQELPLTLLRTEEQLRWYVYDNPFDVMNKKEETQQDGKEFERFEDLARRIISVPKSDVDEHEKKEKHAKKKG